MNSEELQREFEIPTPEQHKANVLRRLEEKKTQIFRKQTAQIVNLLNKAETISVAFSLNETIEPRTCELFSLLGYEIAAGFFEPYYIQPKQH